jgi:predicted Fe-S protein YdhL (DUF1289 family)
MGLKHLCGVVMNSLQPALTPCAGRCSTVFGDSVCRGCRRFSHEVIDWNRYTPMQREYIWQRLDQQLNQIVLPLVQIADEQQLQQFIEARQLRLSEQASRGRQVYEVLRVCQRQPQLTEESGLALTAHQIDQRWQTIEHRLYDLAVASFEFAWLRAAKFQSGT